jgi:hypothetical protein
MAERFGANAPRKKLTLRLSADVYSKLHAYASERMAPHNRVIERAVVCFLSAKCPSRKSDAK